MDIFPHNISTAKETPRPNAPSRAPVWEEQHSHFLGSDEEADDLKREHTLESDKDAPDSGQPHCTCDLKARNTRSVVVATRPTNANLARIAPSTSSLHPANDVFGATRIQHLWVGVLLQSLFIKPSRLKNNPSRGEPERER